MMVCGDLAWCDNTMLWYVVVLCCDVLWCVLCYIALCWRVCVCVCVCIYVIVCVLVYVLRVAVLCFGGLLWCLCVLYCCMCCHIT